MNIAQSSIRSIQYLPRGFMSPRMSCSPRFCGAVLTRRVDLSTGGAHPRTNRAGASCFPTGVAWGPVRRKDVASRSYCLSGGRRIRDARLRTADPGPAGGGMCRGTRGKTWPSEPEPELERFGHEQLPFVGAWSTGDPRGRSGSLGMPSRCPTSDRVGERRVLQ